MSANTTKHRALAAMLALTLAMATIMIGPAAFGQADNAAQKQAKQILEAAAVRGGLVVHLASGDGALTAALHAGPSYLVQGLDTDAARVEQARRRIAAMKLYGPVSVDRFDGKRLPYVDNLVNLIVAAEPTQVPADEMMRALAPGGVAYVREGDKWTRRVKPVPDDIDEWTHYLHDATGNAVAHDTVVGPPRHLQWLGSPRWSRHHDRMASMSALVSAGGRMFYIMDEGSRASIQLPPKWTLIARDAFNGTVLWKQPIASWQNHLWPLKSGPTQLARRLVADKDRVYVTLGYEAPLTVLDAATGRVLRTIADTKSTEEIIASDGVVFLQVNSGPLELSQYAPQLVVGDQNRVGREFTWNKEQPRRIMAVEADSGRVLWKLDTLISPLTLAADAKHVYFHDGEKVVCLDRGNGQVAWKSAPAATRDAIAFNFGPRVVAYHDVVLYAGGDRKMRALDAATGKELWTAQHDKSAYASPEDLLVVGGLVWSAPTTSTKDTGVFTGRDPKSGEVKKQFPPDVDTYWFHHRCYMAKATDRFLMPSRTGIEFVDPQKEHWDINDWVRGGCLYGVMPCNGLVYAPPHDCACYPESKLYGFNALAPASSSRNIPRDVKDAGRLERGPAFAAAIEAPDAGGADWPTYRHDTTRSGATADSVSTDLKPAWRADLGGELSAIVVAGGRLFVAQKNAHTVHALDAKSGARLWAYTAGGRVDSPPTVAQGRVLFGSADGWVYCLRAADGALVWRFRAAPVDQRLTVFEQIESVWPVSGSVLVQGGAVYFVAGRSMFLDGGLRFIKLDVATGRKLAEQVLDDRVPNSDQTLQDRVEVLNMPVSLPDVLSSDGQSIYMRSQQFDLEGNRGDLGPHSGNAAAQAAVQGGPGAHLFAPFGFLDDTWFHRSYWVYGRSFAGGYGGYFQAAKFTPSGRMLVFAGDNVFGFARKPRYLRWTTPLEYQLFATSREAPRVVAGPRKSDAPMIRFANSDNLDPTGKPVTVEAWVNARRPNGVIVARGGPAQGFALVLRGGRPQFAIRAASALTTATAQKRVVGRWVHLVGVLTAQRQVQLYVDGKLAATAQAQSLMTVMPVQAMQIGADEGSAVGDYNSPLAFTGIIDEVKVYYSALSADQVQQRFAQPNAAPPAGAKLVLACSFSRGDASDASGLDNHGQVEGPTSTEGKVGKGMQFTGGGQTFNGSFVKDRWTRDLPLFVQAIALTDKALFIAGPPDLIDEEQTFSRFTEQAVQADLAEQAAALDGAQGAMLWAVSPVDGSKLAEHKLDAIPVWDGMAVANHRLYLATRDGRIVCFE